MSVDYKIDFTTFKNVVNNQLKSASNGKTRHSIDPSTEEALPEVPFSTKDDVDEAVNNARAAFPAWRDLSYDERAQKMLALADGVEANQQAFQDLLVKESGKPAQTAGIEVAMTIGHLREIAKLRLPAETIEDTEERSVVVRYTPLGVGCGIVPWNWPLLLGIGKVGSALLTGNTFIWKSSPFTPYSGLKLAELGAKIFPPGVLQALSGGDDLGPMVTEHPGIDKISFTGSTFTGKKVMESCSRTLKRVTLELGGNDPAIICDDVDLEKVVPKIGTFAFLNSGQICMDIKRVYVHEKIYDAFREALVNFTKAVKTGPASDPEVLVGPIQNSMQYEKVKDMYTEIAKQGWNAALGGAVHERNAPGYFVQPAIIDNPPDDSRIVVEEPFGPIIPLLKWSDEADVVRRANDTKMGLGASVWSKDLEKAGRMASKLEAGSVWVNTHFELAPYVPFGGHKWSGMGMEWGVVGMKGWCYTQSMWTRKAL
ncbi:putative aldehyde dehydrogenase-like protein [Botryosphaeria dothidea]|uniref:aldehyde dehydrogenase (NAD(+)) n=1 Tax=Botryosphaeria dothidea TaxID=55169 RepID=A0A8H4J1R3_9PEZI|nr:putative aldehyde dehydrogenase-like protein [Botryosphaeria dothidea]